MSLEGDFKKWGKPEEWSKFNIVTVHPLADQHDLLKALNIAPDECTHVGVHWLYKDDIYFLSISSVESDPYIYCYRKFEQKYCISFNVRTRKKTIEAPDLEAVLIHLSEWIGNEGAAANMALEGRKIYREDVLAEVAGFERMKDDII